MLVGELASVAEGSGNTGRADDVGWRWSFVMLVADTNTVVASVGASVLPISVVDFLRYVDAEVRSV
jgi:hypothetical protein